MTTERKQSLRQIMTMAWSFVKNHSLSMAEALKCAWANMKFKALAKKGIVEFTFRKVDGTIRKAIGTLKEGVVPATQGTRKQYANTQCYFDTEKGEWRCFKTYFLLDIKTH